LSDLNPSQISKLRASTPVTENNAEEFLSLAEDITSQQNKAVIKDILLLSAEPCDLEGVSDTLANLLEVFPADVYVSEMLNVVEEIDDKSHLRSEREIAKLLWSQSDLEVFKRHVRIADKNTKNRIQNIINRIKVDVDGLSKQCEELLDVL